MIRDMIAILDFGSQYGQLIARRVREHNVYSRICPAGTTAQELSQMPLKGIILSGGPASVYAPGAPRCDEKIFEIGVPILGICYGMQLGCQILGAEIIGAESREYGRAALTIADKSDLFANLPDETLVWASHGDQVGNLGADFVTLARTRTCPYAAVRHTRKSFFGVQFHPEVSHTLLTVSVTKSLIFQSPAGRQSYGYLRPQRRGRFLRRRLARPRGRRRSARLHPGGQRLAPPQRA